MAAPRSRPHQHAQHDQRQRHRYSCENADGDMGGTPAIGLHAPVDDGRPDRATDVVAAGGDRDRESAIALEPVRGFSHQRSERRRRRQADEKMQQDVLPDRRRQPGADIAKAEKTDADADGGDDAVAVADLAGHDLADAETKHHQREGERGGAARHAEFGLDGGQRHHDRPHADTAERADQHGYGKPDPCPARIGNEQRRMSAEINGSVHGARNLVGDGKRSTHNGAILGMRNVGHRQIPRCNQSGLRGPLSLNALDLSTTFVCILCFSQSEIKTAF